MAATRRRSTDAREECWHIYYGDVRVGTIAKRVGNPFDTDPWQWSCGFYPGSHPGEHQDGTAATFDEARRRFRASMDLVSVETYRSRFPGVARSTGMDGREISPLR